MKRPNVLILYTDQQRWDTIHAAGYKEVITPNLDRLASEGVLFENAFCNNPVCMPSRQSMLSGQYPSTIGTTCNGIEMREDVLTLPRILSLYGYHTANIGKLHFKNHSNRDHREVHPDYGFDQLVISDEPGCYDDAYIKWVEEKDPSQVENCRCSTPPAWVGEPVEKQPRNTHEPYIFEGPEELTHTAFVAEQCVEYLKNRRDDRPFLLIAGFYAPHCPLNPPARFVDWYDPDKLSPPRMNPGEDTRGLPVAEWRRIKAFYYALVSHVDDQIGRILTAPEEAGLSDETLVLFTSDHGEHLGDHGLIQKGPPGLDSCVHVPLIMRYPAKIEPNRQMRALVEAVDIAPTILDYCGIQVPPIMQGRSIRPYLEGRPYKEHSSVYIEYKVPFGLAWKTVRTHTFKYCLSNRGDELLFDLIHDPHELHNVAHRDVYQEAKQMMQQELLTRWFEVESQYPKRTGAY